ncbi:MAG: tRNA adenosine(34) deaminase TadA [Minicystis sp.]
MTADFAPRREGEAPGGQALYAAGVVMDAEAASAAATPEAVDDADARFMREALREAEAAAEAGDVPVGAVVVDASGVIVGRGRNRREADQDPTAHAEVDALRRASAALGHWRLEGATVYVTLEPCPMCAGALVNARVARVVYGCPDPKAGAVDTLFTIGRDLRLNHRFAVTAAVLADDCAGLLKAFFARLRARNAKSPTTDPT